MVVSVGQTGRELARGCLKREAWPLFVDLAQIKHMPYFNNDFGDQI